MIVGRFVVAFGMVGMIEASAIERSDGEATDNT
jgi:hypothetical protein